MRKSDFEIRHGTPIPRGDDMVHDFEEFDDMGDRPSNAEGQHRDFGDNESSPR